MDRHQPARALARQPRARDPLARRGHDPRASARSDIRSPFALHAVVHKRDRRLFDLDGVVPSIKAAVDGCRTAGLIEDDNWRHMVRLTVEAGDPDPTPYLQLRFEEIDDVR